MRPITSLQLHNFRGFVGERSIDLDADLILVSGKNGAGKTSLLLAIDLLLNGRTTLIEQAGELRSRGTNVGSVGLLGPQPLHLDLSTSIERRAHADLLERAQFFFPEGLASPENSQDILSIVAPASSAWESIRAALDEAQVELARTKASVFVKDFDVDRERRNVVQRFETAKSGFSADDVREYPWSAMIRDTQNLIIHSGNLANHWQSQLRNLLGTLVQIADTAVPSADETSDILEAIAEACEAVKRKIESSRPVDKSLGSLLDDLESVLSGLSPNSAIEWEKLFNSNVGDTTTIDRLTIALKQKLEELNFVRLRRQKLDVDESALAPSMEQLAIQAEDWIESIRGLPSWMQADRAQLESWLADILKLAPQLAKQARDVGEKLRQAELATLGEISRDETRLNELRNEAALRKHLLPLKEETWVSTSSTVGELRQRLREHQTENRRTRTSFSRVTTALYEIARAARTWSSVEREIARQALLPGTKENRAAVERLVSEAERTLKRALGKDSVFSVTYAIDETQLRQLVMSLNQLLARFHFPSEFLPIQLQVVPSRAKVPAYKFMSALGPEYAGLSTGQKTQLAICWSVCLSYALREKITHPVIAFDDFTTALDMGQLIPAAGILRQLAYCESEEYRRQVIVTSHHEDLTNRLLGYLLPPAGRSMKVIEMLEWTPSRGPEMQFYDVKPAAEHTSAAELAIWLNAQLSRRPV